MSLDIRLIEAFVHIMRAGSLTRAESLTGSPKATLSRQLARLERELGTELLTRSTRRLTPTAAGRALHAHGEALLAEVSGRLASARTEIQELHSGAIGELSLLSDSQFSTTFVCHVVRLFLERHPNMQCRLDVAGQAQAPGANDVDCYICAEPPDLPDLVGKPLGRISHGLYASPDYLRRHGTPVTPADLAAHSAIVLHEAADAAEVLLHDDTGSQPWRPRPALSTNDHWVMKTFCLDGFGLALLPDFFAQPEVARNSLVSVLPAWKPEARRIYCAYRKQRYGARTLKAFVELMTHSLADIDSLNRYVSAGGPRNGATRHKPA